MSDAEEVNVTEFFADIAILLAERDLLAGNAWRVGFALSIVVDYCLGVGDDYEGGPKELAADLIVEIVKTLTYAHVHVIPSEGDIDQQAQMLRDMLDKADEIGKNKNTDKEED